MKVTLIQGRYFNSWEALGLGYIGSYLQAKVPDIKLGFYQGCFDDDEAIISGSLDSDIVAFSATSPSFPHCVRIGKALKKINPRIHTVVGGYHASAVSQDCLVEGIDQVVKGEGEAAMLEVVRGSREKIVSGTTLNFNEMPWPDRQFIRTDRHIPLTMKNNGIRIAAVQGHRACPFMCKYCADGFKKVLYDGVQKVTVRYRNVSDLVDEIESLVDTFGIQLIKFVDPTWNTDVKWVVDFCKEKIRRGVKVPFYATLHAGLVSQEMADLMAQAGSYQTAIGIESGSPKILNQIGKGTKVESIKRCVEIFRKTGVNIRGFFILGMPEENNEDLQLTQNLADELNLDEYGFTILCPYPGTQMYDPVGFAKVDWEKADEYANDFWRTKYLTNQELKDWQTRLSRRFSKKLTWHNKILLGES